MYSLDTCVVSETRQKKPNRKVIEWLSRQDANTLFVSAVTIGEIKNGICALGPTKKAKELANWLAELESEYASRILSVNVTVTECWGEMLASAARIGKPRPAIDALIAATAKVDNLVLVTRNVDDMKYMGVKIYDPFVD